MKDVRFRKGERRRVTSAYMKLYKELKKNFKDAKDNNWHDLWGWGSGRANLNLIPGIDTNDDYYDYSVVDSCSVGPCIVWASKDGIINEEFLNFINENYGKTHLHHGLSSYQFLAENVRDNDTPDRYITIPTFYITIDKFYNENTFAMKEIPNVI